MHLVDRFFADPNPTNTKEFLDSCWCWAYSAMDSLASPQPLPGGGGVGYIRRCSKVANAVHKDVKERLKRMFTGRQLESHRMNQSTVFAELTDGYYQYSEHEHEIGRYEGLRDFVTALTCYRVVLRAETEGARERAAKILALALIMPVEQKQEKQQHLIVDAERLFRKKWIERWLDNPPQSFGDAVATARAHGRWRVLDAFRTEQRVRRAAEEVAPESVDSVDQDDLFRSTQASLYGEVLDKVYVVLCKLASCYPHEREEQLFLWLILGGLSHTRPNQCRRETLPYLVQPKLIDLLRDRRGKNFIRRIQNRLENQLHDDGVSVWRPAQDRFLQLIKAQGVRAETLESLRQFLGVPPDPAPARLALVRQAPAPRAQKSTQAATQTGTSLTVAPAVRRDEDRSLGWRLLSAVGEQTFAKLRAGHLTIDPLVEDPNVQRQPYRTVRKWLHSESGAPPSREHVAAATKLLCHEAATQGWSTILEALQEGGKS